jgi:coenzyme PQQ synthesis protein D (PqqD)
MSGKEQLSVRREEVAAKIIDNEAILINLTTGLYYSMGAVGGRVWSLIERKGNADEIAATIASEYDVAPETAVTDVHALVRQLLDEKLIDARPSAVVAERAARAVNGKGTEPYSKPELKKFSDMAEIFAMDPPLPGLAKTASH